MTNDAWRQLHESYSTKDWIDKPSLFALDAIKYFPPQGSVLDLGAGHGQDSRFFAARGYHVTSTDLETSALEKAAQKLTDDIKDRLTLSQLDLRKPFPFAADSFDVVYAHLSLHYFDLATTKLIFGEICRVLKPAALLAFFTNSTSDPEYGTGTKLENDYFKIDGTAKRYLTSASAAWFAKDFSPVLVDNKGETYKDADKGVHNLIRFIGHKLP